MKNKICENTYEHEYWNLNKYVLGIDEAGRGPLAGPLVVAGVVFEIGYENPAIYDSKSLSEKKREELFDIIQEDALDFEIKIVTEEEIDKYNIYRADQRYGIRYLAGTGPVGGKREERDFPQCAGVDEIDGICSRK